MNKYGIRIKFKEITNFSQLFTKKGAEKIEKLKKQLEEYNYKGIMIEYPYAIIVFDSYQNRDECFEEFEKQNKKVKKIEFIDEKQLS